MLKGANNTPKNMQKGAINALKNTAVGANNKLGTDFSVQPYSFLP